jgi:hypothetical protein
MTKNDMSQKLALLPEGLAERNIQSWSVVVEYFGRPVDAFIAEYFPYTFEMQEVAIVFSKSEQAKLFKAEGQTYHHLIISTTDDQVKIGEPYLMVFIDRGFLTAQYGIDEESSKYHLYKRISSDNLGVGDEAMTILDPMLNLLWDETRGKKNVS